MVPVKPLKCLWFVPIIFLSFAPWLIHHNIQSTWLVRYKSVMFDDVYCLCIFNMCQIGPSRRIGHLSTCKGEKVPGQLIPLESVAWHQKFWAHAASDSDCTASGGWIVNDYLEGTEEEGENPQSGKLMPRPRCKRCTSWIQARSVTAWANLLGDWK
jgi:hypothetical protein